MSDTYELFQLGRSHLRNGMAAQATVSLEKAKRAEPRSRSIREALGIAYFRIGRWQEAEAEFRALVELAPSDEFLLMAQPDLIGDLPSLPSNWLLRSERAQSRGFFARLLWEQRVLPRIAQRWRADVLLSFGSFMPLRAPCPTVLEAGMVITCEPAATEDDGLYCTEQVIVVGDRPEVLSAYPTELASM